jgi:hypothetical protein
MNNPRKKTKEPHPLSWIIEPLLDEPSYIEKPMFGCLGCYLHGKLMLVLASREEPWKGLLIPTEKDVHKDLMAEFKSLEPHPVLGKWLYLPEKNEEFENIATEIIEHVQFNDPRIGVEPKTRINKSKRQSSK